MRIRLRWLWAALGSELRSAHAGSALGAVWLLLAPGIQVAMYVFLFQVVWRLRVQMSPGASVEFVWYLISAYLPVWAFQEALVRASASLTGNAHIIRNTLFPPWLLVLARGLVPYAVLLVICIPLWLVLHANNLFILNLADLFWLTFTLVCQVAMTLGLAMFLASISVLVRDIVNVLPPLLMGMVLTAPVLYPLDNVPTALQEWFWLNPLTVFAEGYHQLLLTQQGLSLPHAVAMALIGTGAVALGAWAYRKIETELPDLL